MTELIIEIDEFTLHVYCDDVEAVFALDEAQRRGISLGEPYSAEYHKAHTSPGKNHLHVYKRKNQIFSINVDGTAHDQSHGVRIPNRVARGILTKFPNVQLPPGNLIESMSVLDDLKWVNEAANI